MTQLLMCAHVQPRKYACRSRRTCHAFAAPGAKYVYAALPSQYAATRATVCRQYDALTVLSLRQLALIETPLAWPAALATHYGASADLDCSASAAQQEQQ